MHNVVPRYIKSHNRLSSSAIICNAFEPRQFSQLYFIQNCFCLTLSLTVKICPKNLQSSTNITVEKCIKLLFSHFKGYICTERALYWNQTLIFKFFYVLSSFSHNINLKDSTWLMPKIYLFHLQICRNYTGKWCWKLYDIWLSLLSMWYWQAGSLSLNEIVKLSVYHWRITINEPVDYMAQAVMILMRGKDITKAIGRVGPWKSQLFWAQTALALLEQISGPKKVSTFMVQPYQWPA